MIESTDFTHSSRRAWKTINKLTKDYTEPQQQCKFTADQVALLLNGKGNKLHVPRREKMPRQTVTESKLTSPFLMEDLLQGVKALKNSKAAGLDDIGTQDVSFEKTESTLSAALDSIGDYYEKNHLRANPDKTQTCVFHLRNRKANRQLNIT